MSAADKAGESERVEGTAAADRVADLLLALSTERAPVGVSELARRLQINKAVVFRSLRSLASRGLVELVPESRKYRLGPAAAAMGARALAELDLRAVALPVLYDLAAASGETATVAALVGRHSIMLDQVVSRREIRMAVQLGQLRHLHAGASSRAMLAFLPDEAIARLLDGPPATLTSRTPTAPQTLWALIEETRRTGVAVSVEEREGGAAAVAAPVFGLALEITGAISVCGPVDRFTNAALAEFGPLVKEAAREVSEHLRRARGDGGDTGR